MADVNLTYSVGTASVVADGTVVTLSGAILADINVKQWDAICIDPANSNILVPITHVDIATSQVTIPEWNGGAKTNVPYVIYQLSPLRYAGAKSLADVDDMISKLNTEGWYRYINPAYADPTAAGIVANEGQFAFKYTTGQLWIMSGGTWQFVGVYKGFSAKGAWSNATTYNTNDVVSYNGSSYIAVQSGTNHLPTDTTWWMLLAAKGDIGPATLKPLVAWATATAYAPGPPADYVTIGGSSYACTVAHTSAASFATDLAAGRWVVVALKGTDAPAYGGTSATSLVIGTGSKAFTTQSNLAYLNGARVRASSAANTSNWMEGVITYSGTTLTMTVDKTNGAGTFGDWNFNIVGQPGAGDLSSANNLSDVANKKTALDNITIRGADVASAATIDLEAATGSIVDVTGNVDITAITLAAGHRRTVRFTGVLTLTHGASLVLPGAANIVTAFGDYAEFVGYPSGVVRCVDYQKANGQSIIAGISGSFGYRNRLVNPSGQIWQWKDVTSGTGVQTNTAYGFDQWFAQVEANPITISQQTNVENGTPFMMRHIQANAAAQRFGIAQPIEAANILDARGKTVSLSGRVRASASMTLRFAILEWTGTADNISRILVNNWASTTYTPGNFFNSSAINNVVAIGSMALAANTLSTINLSGTLSSNVNNLFVFFWTEGQAAQNVSFDIGKMQLEVSATPTELAFRSYQEEFNLCKRYARVIGDGLAQFNYINIAYTFSSSILRSVFQLGEPMMRAPGIGISNPSDFQVDDPAGSTGSVSSVSGSTVTTPTMLQLQLVCSGLTTGRGVFLQAAQATARIYLNGRL